ncbi:unnamed protein product [Rotaria magnacalcarata]|uniref:Uncharacterized protein n=1 Tax=Rotaria magnacalcarata TaxID=392030 RepID=A0A816LEU6_9BILA|nr:unnamed protein product [Rotaria magnacalcarata]CAF1628386.1 unnamed protein product [Rotaria magnacalcarata]CAF1936195.1 unnamed protein product [Rotaria magnacalcarata]CAF3954777.1 unnamed protein product [Rotaria magnacalcarata]CAF4767513.1 unnamed protein product [Rotaria magnacalcarata]
MYRRLKEHGAPPPNAVTPDESIRCSARIAAKATTTSLVSDYDSSVERNGDATESTKTIATKFRLSDIKSAVQRHEYENKHNIDWKNWSVVSRDRHSYRLLIRESLAIAESQPSLNATTRSVPLLIYPEGCPRNHNNMDKQLKENKERQ